MPFGNKSFRCGNLVYSADTFVRNMLLWDEQLKYTTNLLVLIQQHRVLILTPEKCLYASTLLGVKVQFTNVFNAQHPIVCYGNKMTGQ